MGEKLTLTAADGHGFGAYRARPTGTSKGGVVVLPEIFGVNAHIREVCDGFAEAGFDAVSPQLYDRAERDVELGYTPDDVARGRDIRTKVSWDNVVADVAPVVALLAADGKVGSTGYCWGGSCSYLTGCRLPVSCCVVYYGGQIVPMLPEKPKVPMLAHFGEKDAGIPLTDVEKIKEANPGQKIHVYPDADHGFNCDHRGSYQEAAQKLALERTVAFFTKHLA